MKQARRIALAWVAWGMTWSSGVAVQEVSFGRDVLPLLADRCFHCHGPDEEVRESALRLDVPDGPEGSTTLRGSYRVIEPGSLEKSELWYRLNADTEAERMPPADSAKRPLSAAEKDVIRRWILSGAKYERHWAFVAPVEPEVPEVAGGEDLAPIDRFVRARLAREGLTPSPPADRRTLIRRVTLDLTGLPPTRDEVHAFLADPAPDAYERLVDRLLQRPQYGEHMARYWLDLVRFADTNGMHHDHYREMSPYRDWVIRSFADNLPYDRFVTAQLAGDLADAPTTDDLVASGFQRLHLIIDVGTALPEESHAKNVIDRVTAVGTAFLGLTVGCAVCHDHKYDPLKQREFYALSAFFNNLDAAPETGPRSGTDFRRGLQPPYVNLPSEEQAAALAQLEAELKAAEEALAASGEETPKEHRDEVRDRRDRLLLGIPAAMVMKERAEVRPTHVLIRGQYDQPGDLVERGTPAFLPPMTATEGPKTRRDLAQWLVSPDHPLTARVEVNRIWQQCFGVGLVKTAEDFGVQGERPSHPELLDHLALAFVRSGWDGKALVRSIVCSATYRQSSVATPERYRQDPENRLLARGARFRLDAEVIRDQVLATSGLLSPRMYGRSVKPPQPSGVWAAVTLPDSYPRVFQADQGEAIHRRSIYTFWKRGLPPPQMTILNAPSREFCVARRERTNTATQALLLLNEEQYLKAAGVLAARILGTEPTDGARVDALYETLTAHLPDPAEQGELLGLLEDLRAHYAEHTGLAEELAGMVQEEIPEGAAVAADLPAGELAAWTLVASTVYNLDATRNRE